MGKHCKILTAALAINALAYHFEFDLSGLFSFKINKKAAIVFGKAVFSNCSVASDC